MLIADRKSKVKEGQVGVVRADKLQITAADDSPEKLASNLHTIMQAIPHIVVAGISTVRRAVIQSSQKKDRSGGARTAGMLPERYLAFCLSDASRGRMPIKCFLRSACRVCLASHSC